ncbi:methyltransferase domain-containing protein [Halopenitus persicus]|uniref:methyltransferase domain-containing protein n=1 Tax=Halopenitus persicus TaxID=1048396 RepID=UPI000BBB1EDB|nr:class I SAM-dependent methyltransferase [Halopenitus persicus]
MVEERILEIGAGQSPDSRATETLDIRDDLEHIDYSGIDIGADEWPVGNDSIDMVIANHVVEHVSPESIGHIFEEVDRVVQKGGRFHVIVPHTGTWQAATDPTHQGTGGWTPDIVEYFTGNLEEYFPKLKWNVSAKANLSFPLFLRERLRLHFTISSGSISSEIVKIPFVSGEVEFWATIQ